MIFADIEARQLPKVRAGVSPALSAGRMAASRPPERLLHPAQPQSVLERNRLNSKPTFKSQGEGRVQTLDCSSAIACPRKKKAAPFLGPP
jgi:hypothetical protein